VLARATPEKINEINQPNDIPKLKPSTYSKCYFCGMAEQNSAHFSEQRFRPKNENLATVDGQLRFHPRQRCQIWA